MEEEVRLGSEMAEFKKEITIGSTLAIILVLVLVSAVVYLPLGPSSTTSSSSSRSKGATATFVTCASNSFVEGGTNCEARVSGDPPTGTVSWEQVSGPGKVTFAPSTCQLIAGVCAVSVTESQPGSVAIAASYGGDQHNAYSTAQVSIPTGFPTFGVAVNPRTNVVFGADQGKDRLIGINETSGDIVGNVSVGDFPYWVAVNPVTNVVYVTNIYSQSLSVVNGTTFAPIATVQFGTLSREVAVDPTTNMVYVTNLGATIVSVISGYYNTIVSRIPLSGSPDGIAVNPTEHIVYVAGCLDAGSGFVSAIAGSNNSVVATIPIQGGCPGGIAVNPLTGRVYVSSSDSNGSSLLVIDGATNQIIKSIEAPYSIGVTVNSLTNLVYAVGLTPPSVTVINGSTNRIVTTVSTGGSTFVAAVNPVTDLVYVSNFNFYAIQIIDGRTNALVGEPVIRVAGVCVSATNGCSSGSAFSLTAANNGTVTINPTTIGITVSENRGGSYIYATFSLSTTSSITPTGPAQTIVLPSWNAVGNKTGSFSPGDTVGVLVCLPIGPCSSDLAVVSA